MQPTTLSLMSHLMLLRRGQNGCYIPKCGSLLSPLATPSEARMVNGHIHRHKQQHTNRLYPFAKCESVRMNEDAVDIMLLILLTVNGVPLPMHHATKAYRGRECNPPHNTS
jgi:hypothetical protein